MKTLHWLRLLPLEIIPLHFGVVSFAQPAGGADDRVDAALARLRDHTFHPIREGRTYDRMLDKQGVADLSDQDWRVRTRSSRVKACRSSRSNATTPTRRA